MRRIVRCLALCLAVTAISAGWAGSVEVTYLGNEGFLLSGGGKKVLIDALHGDGLIGYVALGQGPREKLEQAVGDFDGVDLILATHYHGDHFDPRSVGRHLSANPDAYFLSTPQAVERLRGRFADFDKIESRVRGVLPPEGEPLRLELGGVGVTVLYLHHGRERPVENLGFIVELDGMRLLHIGDTEAVVDDFRRYEILDETLDVAFVPSWYFRRSRWKPALEQAIRADHVVGMHIPAADAPRSYFEPLAGVEAVFELIESRSPSTTCFRELLERKTFATKPQPER